MLFLYYRLDYIIVLDKLKLVHIQIYYFPNYNKLSLRYRLPVIFQAFRFFYKDRLIHDITCFFKGKSFGVFQLTFLTAEMNESNHTYSKNMRF